MSRHDCTSCYHRAATVRRAIWHCKNFELARQRRRLRLPHRDVNRSVPDATANRDAMESEAKVQELLRSCTMSPSLTLLIANEVIQVELGSYLDRCPTASEGRVHRGSSSKLKQLALDGESRGRFGPERVAPMLPVSPRELCQPAPRETGLRALPRPRRLETRQHQAIHAKNGEADPEPRRRPFVTFALRHGPGPAQAAPVDRACWSLKDFTAELGATRVIVGRHQSRTTSRLPGFRIDETDQAS